MFKMADDERTETLAQRHKREQKELQGLQFILFFLSIVDVIVVGETEHSRKEI